jgi:hypothetical protein
MATEIITLAQIQSRSDSDYNFMQSGDPLTGYDVSTGSPGSSVASFDATGVTLTVTNFFEGRLCRPEFRISRDLMALANIVDNLGSPAGSGPTEFILISATDDVQGYLEDKLIDGDGILVTKSSDSAVGESLQLDVRVKNTIELDSDQVQLVNDESAPGSLHYYGTNVIGTKGWYGFTEIPMPAVTITSGDASSDYLDSKVVDGDGILTTILTDTAGEQTLDFSVRVKNTIEIDSDQLQLINDENAPGNSKFYGTTTVGVKGWQTLPIKNSIEEDSAQLQFVNDSNAPGNSKFYGTTTLGVKGWQSLPVKNSIVEDSAELQLVNDSNVPGNSKYYGTNLIGTKGWHSFGAAAGATVSITIGDAASGYLDDKLVDGDGLLSTLATDTSGDQTLGFSVQVKNSIEIDSDFLQLVNDSNAPGASKYYGTNSGSIKGYFDLPLSSTVGVSATDTVLTYLEDKVEGHQSVVITTEYDTVNDEVLEVRLIGDETNPGVSKVYGTDASGVKGWQASQGLEISQLASPVGIGGVAGDSVPTFRRCEINNTTGEIELDTTGAMAEGPDLMLSGSIEPDSSGSINPDQQIIASKIWNSVWNDIADFQDLNDSLVYGKCYFDTYDGAKICKERCQESVIGIASDTFGYALGATNNKVPIAISGWVLANVDQEYRSGIPLTNSDNGDLTEMTLEEKQNYPERIVAIYKKKERSEFWGPEGKEIKVNNRHWVKIK